MARPLNDPQVVREIARRFAAGETQIAISTALGIHQSSVSRHLGGVRNEARSEATRKRREQASEVARRYAAGETHEEIAEGLGLDVEKVRGIVKRKRVRPRSEKQKASPTVRTVSLSRVPLTGDQDYGKWVLLIAELSGDAKRFVRNRVTAYRAAGTDGEVVVREATEGMRTRLVLFDLLAGRVLLDGEGGRLERQLGAPSAEVRWRTETMRSEVLS